MVWSDAACVWSASAVAILPSISGFMLSSQSAHAALDAWSRSERNVKVPTEFLAYRRAFSSLVGSVVAIITNLPCGTFGASRFIWATELYVRYISKPMFTIVDWPSRLVTVTVIPDISTLTFSASSVAVTAASWSASAITWSADAVSWSDSAVVWSATAITWSAAAVT